MEPGRVWRDHERLHRACRRRAAPGRSLTDPNPLPDAGDRVEIHYRRPHSGVTTYRQLVLESTGRCVVTFQEEAPIPKPVVVDRVTILAPGSPVIWFTIPGAWHDIGIFHLADGSPTGIYANVLSPVRFEGQTSWRTTDLYLDVWVPLSGEPQILDEAELAEAVAEGHVSKEDAFKAKNEAGALMMRYQAGLWPPTYVAEWDLDRARRIRALLKDGR
ncbi:MAG: DUF402 domain-containing protein [Longimicrobiales bacterium]